MSELVRVEKNFQILSAKEESASDVFCTTKIVPNLASVEKAAARGYTHITTSCWNSNLSEDDINRNSGLQRQLESLAASVAVIHAPDVYSRNMHLSRHYDGNDYNTIISIAYPPFRGRYIIICVPSHSQSEAESLSREVTELIVNQLRVHYGNGAALEKLVESIIDITSLSVSSQNTSHVFREVTKEAKSDIKVADLSAESPTEFYFNRDQSALFSKAISATAVWERFLFLWICLEFKIGNGKKREAFFKRFLNSDIINEEVIRLHEIRSKLSHSEKIDISPFDSESALWALKVAVMKDRETQLALAKHYQAWIESFNDI